MHSPKKARAFLILSGSRSPQPTGFPLLRQVLVGVGLIVAMLTSSPSAADGVLFTDVTVFNGVDEKLIENANVLVEDNLIKTITLSLIHISEPTRLKTRSRMPSSA